MKTLNKVQIIGRLGLEPEVKNLSNEGKLVNLSIATDYEYKQKNGERTKVTDWHRCTAFGSICDHIEKYLTKGSSVYVEGRLHTRTYDDKDGVKRYATEIIVNNIIFLQSAQNVPDGGHDGKNFTIDPPSPDPQDM